MSVPCCVCLEDFPDWKLNNPRYCCSVKLCQSCVEKTASCPQCRHKVDPNQEVVRHLQTSSFRCYTWDGFLCLEWYKDGKLDRTDGRPAYIKYYESGNTRTERYYKDGKLDRTDGPAWIHYYRSGQIRAELYYNDGRNYRADGPVSIWYYESGKIDTITN